MSQPKPPPADALPDDLTAASILKSRHAFTAMLNDCVCATLDAAGRSWGGNRHITEKLYSEREYIATGLRLCDEMPGMSGALRDYQAILADRARQQRHQDATTRRQKELIGAKVKP